MNDRLVGVCAGILLVEALYYLGQLAMLAKISPITAPLEPWLQCSITTLVCGTAALLMILRSKIGIGAGIAAFAAMSAFEIWFITRSVYHFGVWDSAFPGRVVPAFTMLAGFALLLFLRFKERAARQSG